MMSGQTEMKTNAASRAGGLGGVMLLLFRPFKVGDYVAAGGVDQTGGQVASTYVFGQSAGHVSLGQGRYVVVVHEEGRGL